MLCLALSFNVGPTLSQYVLFLSIWPCILKLVQEKFFLWFVSRIYIASHCANCFDKVTITRGVTVLPSINREASLTSFFGMLAKHCRRKDSTHLKLKLMALWFRYSCLAGCDTKPLRGTMSFLFSIDHWWYDQLNKTGSTVHYYLRQQHTLPLNLSSEMNYIDNFGVYEIVLISFTRNHKKIIIVNCSFTPKCFCLERVLLSKTPLRTIFFLHPKR